MNNDQILEQVKTGISCLDYLKKAPKGGYICPKCGSGTGNNHDNRAATGGVKYYEKENRWTCHACGTSGDVLDLYQYETGADFKEALATLSARLGLDTGAAGNVSKPTARKDTPKAKAPETGAQSKTEAPAADFTEYYKACRSRLDDPAALDYLKSRGISKETAAAFGIGYDPAADPAGAPGAIGNQYKAHPVPRLIIPTSRGHYVARSIDPKTEPAYKALNPKNSTPAILNAKALHAKDARAVFVTEGPFDALAITEAGFSAVALCSTSNTGKLADMLAEEPPAAPLVLCLDNDDPGRKASAALAAKLAALQIPFLSANVAGTEKDAADAWTADPEALQRNCKAARDKLAAGETSNPQAATGPAPLQTTGAQPMEGENAPEPLPIPRSTSEYIREGMADDLAAFTAEYKTGFEKLDEKAGGLYAGLYVLAALSSLGKTTFALQIADQLAEQGADVLFFSLEQSTLEMVTKSIARQTAQDSIKTRGDVSEGVTSLQLRKGKSTTKTRTAAAEYQAKVKNHVYILEGNFNTTADTIRETVAANIERTGRRPVVVLDYLQILQPTPAMQRAGTREALDASIVELKRMTRDFNTTFFVISSVNRSSYSAPVSFEALKESGGIEFTADVVLGLQLACIHEELFTKEKEAIKKRERITEAKKETPRQIELVCLKNRYGIASYTSHFEYFPQFDLFTEAEDKRAPLVEMPDFANII